MKRDDNHIGRMIKQWAAAVDTSGRQEEVEARLGVQLPDGAPVEATRVNAEGDVTGTLDLRVKREKLPSGGMKIMVNTPPAAEAGVVTRIWFSGRNEEDQIVKVALPIGKVEDGRAEIALSEKGVKNCPIDLSTAVPFSAEVELIGWFEQLISAGTAIVHRLSVSLMPAWEQEPLTAAAASETGPVFGGEDSWVYEDEAFRMVIPDTQADQLLIGFATRSPELEDTVIALPVREREAEMIAYVPITIADDGVTSMSRIVCRKEELAFSTIQPPVIVEIDHWTEDVVQGLEWTLEHAATATLKERVEELLVEARSELEVAADAEEAEE